MATVSELRQRHAEVSERRARAQGAADTAQQEFDAAMVDLRDKHGCDSVEALDEMITTARAEVGELLTGAESALDAAEAAVRDV